jgi:hypothetical protein
MLSANNPSTPPEILDQLTVSEEADIRQGIIKNSNTSPVTLHKLSG